MGFLKDLFKDKTPEFFKMIREGDLDGLRSLGYIDPEQIYEEYPPIMYAVHYTKRNIFSIVKFLIEAGCDVNARDGYSGVKYTPLMSLASCYTPNLKLARLLLENGANVNARSVAGAHALSSCITSKNPEFIELLKEYKVNFNIQNFMGETVFHDLIMDSDEFDFPEDEPIIEEMIKLLVKNGADINIKDKKGQTPLESDDYFTLNCEKMKELIRKHT